ncbi:MAG: hypothetical protein V4487_03600 [Chlamydiota bacterium]
MTIDNIFSLNEWLESEKAGKAQNQLEEKIIQMLFSQDPSSSVFQTTITQLAWLGSRPEQKYFLKREIIALNQVNEMGLCGLWKDVCKVSRKVGHFIADHTVEIAAGIAICATGVGIAYVAGYTLSASVGGVVVAGAGSIFFSEEKKSSKIPSIPFPDPHACSREELAALQQPLSSLLPKVEFPSSVHELLVTADGIWANGQFFSTNALMKYSTFSSVLTNLEERNGFSIGYPKSDWKTFAYYIYLSEHLGQQGAFSYQARGKTALALGNYHQAVQEFGQAIPTDPTCYLERAAALFGLEQYEASLKDYEQFNVQTQTTNSLSVSEFGLGFAKGVPKGIYESGEGLLLFFADFVKHPIQASKQIFDTVTTLVNLVRNDQWGTIVETLTPEIYQLVTQWDTLSSGQRGELAGYAVGKHGADILTPGALAKIASKSAKSAQELVEVCKNLQIAQETLILETAAGIGNSVKIKEVVHTGRTTAFFGQELGFTAREMAELKQAGKLESTINSRLDRLISQSESEVLKAAISQDNHVKMVKDYLGKSVKEIQKGINSYEKQIAIHKDKIVNPSKYYPDWNELHPARRDALINKRWPAEIKLYEEQRNILQSILNERVD